MSKYIGLFSDVESIADEFEVGGRRKYHPNPAMPAGFPTDDQIIVAAYEYEDYSGDAFVLFVRDGKLWEVHGSHCSCYGLEDQWAPEETNIDALKMRLEKGDYGIVNTEPVKALIRAYIRTRE